MRVAILPSDKGACAYYRLAWPANAVAEQTDWDVEIHDPGEVFVRQPFAIQGIDDLDSLDVVVMQRIATPRQVRLVSAFQRLGIAVVIDVDDLLSDIEQDNKSYKYWNESIMEIPRHKYLEQATHNADLVTVSTPALVRRYARHGRVLALRNSLPNHAYVDPAAAYDRHAGRGDRDVVVGWSGSLDSHPHDLEAMGNGLRTAMDYNPRLRFHVVGDHKPVAERLGLDMSRVTGTGWLPIEEYHEALREIDIALVPLVNTRFNNAKSHLKALEFAASGAFVLASNLPEQMNLAQFVPIATVNSTAVEWRSAIEQVAASLVDIPQVMGEDAAEIVRKAGDWAVANKAGAWVAAWERAARRRYNLDIS